MRFRLTELLVHRSVPPHIRSNNGPDFAAKAVCQWLQRVGVQMLFIMLGDPWENGYGRLRDELLDRELFETHWEAQALVER